MAKFDVPVSLVFYNAAYLSSLNLYDFSLENRIILKDSVNYYPKGNGLVESTNKNLICIIKNTLLSHQINWCNALWADRDNPKPSLRTSPYFQVYGKKTILPSNLYLPTLLSLQELGTPFPTIQNRIDTLLKQEEETQKDRENFVAHQSQIKRWFDNKFVGKDEFNVGDLVLKWDKVHEDNCKHTKFQALWIGLFQVKEKNGQHT